MPVGAIIAAATAVVTTAVKIGVDIHAANEQNAMQNRLYDAQEAAVRQRLLARTAYAQAPVSRTRAAIDEIIAVQMLQEQAPQGNEAPAQQSAPAEGSDPPPQQGGQPDDAPLSSGEQGDGGATTIELNGSAGTPVVDLNNDQDDDDPVPVRLIGDEKIDTGLSPNQVNQT